MTQLRGLGKASELWALLAAAGDRHLDALDPGHGLAVTRGDRFPVSKDRF